MTHPFCFGRRCIDTSRMRDFSSGLESWKPGVLRVRQLCEGR